MGSLTPSGRLLAIFAHPDDESLVAGGTLAACAAAEVHTLLVTATRGERGPLARPGLATRDTLGAVREAELRAAAGALGVRAVECLGYPDGELDGSAADGLAADLLRCIRRWQPGAVITFGPEGLYWHPDHVAVHGATMRAVAAAARGGLAPPVYQATWPRGRMGRLVAAMAARGLEAELWGLDPADFGAPPASITTTVGVRRFLAPKLRALRCHRTQLGEDHLFERIPDALAARFLAREYFIGAPPPAAGADWLAGVVARSRDGS